MKNIVLLCFIFSILLSQSVFALQFARPTADESGGGPLAWGDINGGNNNGILYEEIDEVTANDTDYIDHAIPFAATTYRNNLSDVTDPLTSSGHIIKWRYKKVLSGITVNARLELYQGNTLIVARQFNNIGTTFTQDTYTLSAAEADSIADYSDLKVRVTHSSSGAGVDTSLDISWIEFEVPDAPADSTPPTWGNLETNITGNATVNSSVEFRSRWSDNLAVYKYIFSWNASGATCNTWQNDSAVLFQSGNWTNTTKTIPDACEGKQIAFKFYGNDTSNNANSTSEQLLNVSPSPPTWSNLGKSTSTADISTSVTFFSQWNDLQLSRYIFSWNAAGSSCNTWSNDTAQSFQTNNWTNTTKTIPPECEGKTISFRFFANDTINSFNTTDISTVSVAVKPIVIALPPTVNLPPPDDPTVFPPTEIPPPPPATTFDLPTTGVTIRLDPKLVVILYPLTKRKATIHNITEIEPSRYKILLCNQTEIASYEINITSDLAYFCANYSEFPVEDPTISIFRFIQDDWILFPQDKIIKNSSSKVICGQISSTPYLVSGFQANPDSKAALESINDANNTIELAKRQNLSTGEAESLLSQAVGSYYSCNYITANALANQALNSLVTLPNVPNYIPLAIGVVAAIGVGWYYWIKVRVRIKKV